MAVSQINASFQNDGNFSQLDLQDTSIEGPILRIETFRCSQPEGDFGITASGTRCSDIAGEDHLTTDSNKIFRHIYSDGSKLPLSAKLEIRESYDEDGSLEVKTRDIDASSSTFGWTLISHVKPVDSGLTVSYTLLRSNSSEKYQITSPLKAKISSLIKNSVDISDVSDALGEAVNINGSENITVHFSSFDSNDDANKTLDQFSKKLQELAPEWTKNVVTYERMGDFRDKCIHPGTNLTGSNPALASEFLLIRAYRASLISLGRVFDSDMSKGAEITDINAPLNIDPKPGVYNVFLSAYALNISHYQLGIDKVHSDYGGVPMSLQPGSRLENGKKPLVDATNLNKVLTLLSAHFYAPSALNNILRLRPTIEEFGVQCECKAISGY